MAVEPARIMRTDGEAPEDSSEGDIVEVMVMVVVVVVMVISAPYNALPLVSTLSHSPTHSANSGLKPLGNNGSYSPPFNRQTQVWIPPGDWEHAQSGEVLHGPKTINVTSNVTSMPIYHRHGGMLVLAPLPAPKAVASESQWDQLTLEIFPSWHGTSAINRVFVDTKEQVWVGACVCFGI